MAKVRFRGDTGTRVAHQVGQNECIHLVPCEVDPDEHPLCADILDRFAEYAHVPLTSQPTKDAAKEPAQ